MLPAWPGISHAQANGHIRGHRRTPTDGTMPSAGLDRLCQLCQMLDFNPIFLRLMGSHRMTKPKS